MNTTKNRSIALATAAVAMSFTATAVAVPAVGAISPSGATADGSSAATGSGSALTIPTCDDLVNPTAMQKPFGEKAAEIARDEPLVQAAEGPASVELAEAATDATTCLWGVPASESGVWVAVAEVDEEDAGAFRDELENDGFHETTVDGMPVYWTEKASEFSDEQGVTYYGLEGDTWIIVNGMVDETEARAILADAQEAVDEANADE